MSENRRTYLQALFGFDAVVARTPGMGWASPSPCSAWTAADVVAHNVGMNDMIVGFTKGVDARSAAHNVSDEPAAEWRRSRDRLLVALDTAGALQTVAATPWGELPVDKFLGFAWVDPLIHTWDLATATGQTAVLEPTLVARATKQLERAGDSLRGEGRFSASVDLGNSTDPIEKLIALTGRDPRLG